MILPWLSIKQELEQWPQNPFPLMWCASSSTLVEHHGFLSFAEWYIHELYVLLWKLNGKTQGALDELPPTVEHLSEIV